MRGPRRDSSGGTGTAGAVPGATEYPLDVTMDNCQTFDLQDEEVRGTSLFVEEREPDTTYSYRVRAILESGLSTYSNVVTVRTAAEH